MKIIENLKLEKEKGMLLSDAIKWLRDNGASKADSIAAVTKVFSISMSDSKNLIHEHEVWSDVKSRDEQFHDEISNKL